MKNQSILLNIATLIILGAIIMSGCSKKSPSQDPAPTPPPNSDELPASNGLAFCNQKSGSTYDNSLKAYVTTSNTVATDWMLSKVGKVPESFASDGSFIQFFKWKINESGATEIDPSPLQFHVQQIATKNILLNGYFFLKWSDVSGFSDGQSPTDYFNSIRFVIYLRDVSLDFQAIKMVVYKSDHSVADQVDILMPVFDADPERYATTPSGAARSPILKQLHPFSLLQGQGLSQAEYRNLSQGYCF